MESSQQELQLCFKPCLDLRFEHEVIAPQSCKSPNIGNFGTSLQESQDKKPFGCSLCGKVQSILYGGRWWLPLSPGVVSLVSPKSPWLVLAPKVFQHSINQRVGWFGADLSE